MKLLACWIAVLPLLLPTMAVGQEAAPTPLVAPAADGPEAAEEPPLFPASAHLWARFKPGAYRVLKTTTETFNPDGSVLGKSVTTKHEVLKAVADDTYVLEVKASVDLDGKQVEGDWQTRVLRLATDSPGRTTGARTLRDAVVDVDGNPVECQVWEFRFVDEPDSRVERVHVRRDRFPFILRRSTKAVRATDAQEVDETDEMVVTNLNTPWRLRGRVRRCSEARWERVTQKGRTSQVGVLCRTVPGGLVECRSTDTDPEGRVVRWSITELVDYGTGNPSDTPAQPVAERAASR